MVTEAEIEAAKSPKGGWKREQLAKWGVPWPPPKGWKKALLAKGNSKARTQRKPEPPRGDTKAHAVLVKTQMVTPQYVFVPGYTTDVDTQARKKVKRTTWQIVR